MATRRFPRLISCFCSCNTAAQCSSQQGVAEDESGLVEVQLSGAQNHGREQRIARGLVDRVGEMLRLQTERVVHHVGE